MMITGNVCIVIGRALNIRAPHIAILFYSRLGNCLWAMNRDVPQEEQQTENGKLRQLQAT